MPITQLCAAADVQKILSTSGVNLRTDDDAAATSWAIDAASVEFMGFAGLLYSTAALAASNWVLKTVAWLAAEALCERRNNAPSKPLARRCEKIREVGEDIRLGFFVIPDAPQSKQTVPVLRNQRVRLTPIPQVVTEPGRSTGHQEGYPTTNDPADFTDYTG